MTDSVAIQIVLPTSLLSDVRARVSTRRPGSTTASITTAVVSHFGRDTERLEDDALVAEIDAMYRAIERGELELIPAEEVFDEIRAEIAHRGRISVDAAQREHATSDVVVSPGLARGPAVMTQKERITIEIPADVAARLREAVAEGAFASESEAVEEALQMLLFADAGGPAIDDAWLRREVLPVLDRIDRGEENAVPIEDAFRGIEERYLARKARGRAGE